MAPMALQDRAQYLSLALFSQMVVSALIEYVDENKKRKLKPSLNEALVSLSSVQAKRPSTLPRGRITAFANYEHLRTLEEVWSSTERTRAIRMIKTILREPGDPKAKPVANNLIALFSKLQDQALWNFEQPRPISSTVMQRLCKLA
jgi:hypothetical protein